MERVYKTMRNAGALNIVIGIIITVAGLSVGIMSIINGAVLLKRKSEITFNGAFMIKIQQNDRSWVG